MKVLDYYFHIFLFDFFKDLRTFKFESEFTSNHLDNSGVIHIHNIIFKSFYYLKEIKEEGDIIFQRESNYVTIS